MPKGIFGNAERCAIFKDERFLYPEYIPEKLPFREAQIAEIANSLRPLLRNGRPQNLFLFGPSGTGKTVTAKYVLRELEEQTSKAKGIYINCFEFHTRNAVLNKLCIALGNPVPRRGLASDEIYNELICTLKAKGIMPIVVLDEADQLIRDKTSSQLLYDLLRTAELHSIHIGIVLISNIPDALVLLDDRVRSSLSAAMIEFKQYTPQQLKQILGERAKNAFFEDALEEDVINLAAAYAAKCNGDARIAINSLLVAGRIAEKECAKKLSVEHLRKAFENIKPRALEKALPHLDMHEKEILKIMCNREKVFSGELYKIYCSKVEQPITERSFREKLNRLAELKLLEVSDVTSGVRGRTREIKLAQPRDAMLKLFEGG